VFCSGVKMHPSPYPTVAITMAEGVGVKIAFNILKYKMKVNRSNRKELSKNNLLKVSNLR
jgi:hypothetical protein